jgi:hypothetical protein
MPTDPYRNGSSRTGFWLVQEAKRMAQQGKTAQEIVERLDNLYHCDRDWRDFPQNVPSDERPEVWGREVLEKYIAKRKPEWLKGG